MSPASGRCEASLTSATGWRHALTLHRAPAPQLLSDSLCLIVRLLLHAHREAQRRSCERVAALLTQPQARLRKPSGLGKARQNRSKFDLRVGDPAPPMRAGLQT